MTRDDRDVLPPAGWYPQGGGRDRWWNGVSWSDTFRATPVVEPPPAPVSPAPVPPYAQPPSGQGYYAPPQRSSHVLRTLLLVIALLLVVGIGGCAALAAVVTQRADGPVEDQIFGGSGAAQPIVEGRAFSIGDVDYAAGWSLVADPAGDATVTGLRATDDGSESDAVVVSVDVMRGGRRAARIDCHSETGGIAPGASATLTCSSGEALPTRYDAITIRNQS